MKALASQLLVALVVASAALLGYDRLVVRPSLRIGIVDVSAVYRAKEAEFAQLLKGSADADRDKALLLAREFARRLPQALEELPRECGCLVVIRSAVAGPSANSIDLTAALTRKLGT
jgi:hypothetical protein